MDEEIDHLKLYEAVARTHLSGPSTLLIGLDEARAHQRGEPVGKLQIVRRKLPRRPPDQIEQNPAR